MGAGGAKPKNPEGLDFKAKPWQNKGLQMGYTYMKRNGPASASAVTHPVNQLERLVGQGLNPQDYFKNANQAGMNPLDGVLTKASGPGFPDDEKEKKKKSKKKKKTKKDKK